MKRVPYNKDAWRPWHDDSRRLKYTETPILQWLVKNIGPISPDWKQGGNEWIHGDKWAMSGICYFEPNSLSSSSRIVVDQWVEFDDSIDDQLLFEFALKFR